MTDLQQIKLRIYKEKRIDEVLILLGCWGIDTEQNGKLYVAGLPDGENKRSVQVKNNENLSSHIRSRGIEGSIFDIVSYIIFEGVTAEKRLEYLSKSKYWLCNKLGYFEFIDDFYKDTAEETRVKPSYNEWLKKIDKETMTQTLENEIKPLHILKYFGNIPYLGWVKEGISTSTQRYFNVGIDVLSDRITFPIHNKQGDLIGVKGRYCGKNQEIEDKYKYLYLVPCNKSIEFFNLHRALPEIKKKQEVIIVEGAKTVMLLYQWGYKNVISIEGDSLSDHQIRLLKDLGLKVKFIFAWDKDKDTAFIIDEVSKLKGRLRYVIFDKGNLLNEKDSPCDKGKEVWIKLYNDYIYKIN